MIRMRRQFKFENGSVTEWDGKSRKIPTIPMAQIVGTIIYGTRPGRKRFFVIRGGYSQYDRGWKIDPKRIWAEVPKRNSAGGGGDMSTMHVVEFLFNAFVGKGEANSNIEDGAVLPPTLSFGQTFLPNWRDPCVCDPKNGTHH